MASAVLVERSRHALGSLLQNPAPRGLHHTPPTETPKHLDRALMPFTSRTKYDLRSLVDSRPTARPKTLRPASPGRPLQPKMLRPASPDRPSRPKTLRSVSPARPMHPKWSRLPVPPDLRARRRSNLLVPTDVRTSSRSRLPFPTGLRARRRSDPPFAAGVCLSSRSNPSVPPDLRARRRSGPLVPTGRSARRRSSLPVATDCHARRRSSLPLADDPPMKFRDPPACEATGSDLHRSYQLRLCSAFRLSQPLDALLRPQPFRPCFMPVTLMGFTPSEVCSPPVAGPASPRARPKASACHDEPSPSCRFDGCSRRRPEGR
jgi:hypothetical protein